MFTSKTKLRVRYGETDKMGVVYHPNYIPYFEIGRTDALRQIGLSYKSFEDQGIIMPVVDVFVKYHKPAYYDDELTIITTLKEKPNMRIPFTFEIYRDETLLVTGGVSIVCMDEKTNKLVRASEVFKNAFDSYF